MKLVYLQSYMYYSPYLRLIPLFWEIRWYLSEGEGATLILTWFCEFVWGLFICSHKSKSSTDSNWNFCEIRWYLSEGEGATLTSIHCLAQFCEYVSACLFTVISPYLRLIQLEILGRLDGICQKVSWQPQFIMLTWFCAFVWGLFVCNHKSESSTDFNWNFGEIRWYLSEGEVATLIHSGGCRRGAWGHRPL